MVDRLKAHENIVVIMTDLCMGIDHRALSDQCIMNLLSEIMEYLKEHDDERQDN